MNCLRTFAAAAALAVPGFAQIPEIEPNDTKATATAAPGMTSGAYLAGNSIATTAYDYWRVSTAPAALGIYRHELVLTTSGTAGHVGTLRGLNQTGGVVGLCPADGTSGFPGPTDSTCQTSSTSSTPPRMNAWYGFGKGESIYYRVAGTSTTLADYHATLTSTTVVPTVVPGTFNAGLISIQTNGFTTVDTDLFLYDSNFNLVLSPEGHASNDDEHCNVTNTLQSWIHRLLPGGTYYLAVGAYNTATSEVSPTDDDFLTGALLDFPDALAVSTTGSGSDRDFQITDGTNTYTSSGTFTTRYFEAVWFRFDVGGGGHAAYCEPGAAGVIACPCSNPPSGSGRGCDNSQFTGGASIAAAGVSSVAGDTLVFTTAGQTSFGTTILLQGTVDNVSGVPFGQGVRCVDGTLTMLYVKAPGGTGGISAPAPGDPSVTAASAALGDPIFAGQHRYYMAGYRDTTVVGGCPSGATFSATNAIDVTWN